MNRMPIPKTDGLTRRHVELALADLKAGISHPFGPPTRYEVVYNGNRYPPKAAVGLAFKHLRGQMLGPNQFSGGEGANGANRLLRKLGFEVVLKEAPAEQKEFVTSRGIALPSDAKGMASSVWFNLWKNQLWPYQELSEGDILYWYSSIQKTLVWKSRISKIARFPYTSKNEVKKRLRVLFGNVGSYDDYFKVAAEKGYCIAYKVDSISRLDIPKPPELTFPRTGWLRCSDKGARKWLDNVKHIGIPDGYAEDELSEAASEVDESGYFSPATLEDERKRTIRAIVSRRGQSEFRAKLIDAYGGRCAVTGCDALAALEAAHIFPYIGPKTNHVTNGLLVRSDIHTLFDLDLIGIDPKTFAVSLAPAIRKTTYADLHSRKVTLPQKASCAPSIQALAKRWDCFKRACSRR
jgi:hypothetical protein